MANLVRNLFSSSQDGSRSFYSYLPLHKSDSASSRDSMDSLYYDKDLLEEIAREESAKKAQLQTEVITNAATGLADGIIVPFALAAGVSTLSANSTALILCVGVTELIASSIAKAIYCYRKTTSEMQIYNAARSSTEALVRDDAKQAGELVKQTLEAAFPGLSSTLIMCVQMHVAGLKPDEQASFLLKHHHQVKQPSSTRPFADALSLAAGYFLTGLIILLPYLIFFRHTTLALALSTGIAVVALFSIGASSCQVPAGPGAAASKMHALWARSTQGARMVAAGAAATAGGVVVVRGVAHSVPF